MQYIEQPRGSGTAYRYRMKTPNSLKGTPDPWRGGKPFGTWIIRSMGGEKHLPSAKKLRDIYLAEVCKLEVAYRARNRYSLERAELWAQALAEEREDEALVRDLIYDEAERAPEGARRAF